MLTRSAICGRRCALAHGCLSCRFPLHTRGACWWTKPTCKSIWWTLEMKRWRRTGLEPPACISCSRTSSCFNRCTKVLRPCIASCLAVVAILLVPDHNPSQQLLHLLQRCCGTVMLLYCCCGTVTCCPYRCVAAVAPLCYTYCSTAAVAL